LAQKTPSNFFTKLFDLQSKVAVVTGGTGVLCGEKEMDRVLMFPDFVRQAF